MTKKKEGYYLNYYYLFIIINLIFDSIFFTHNENDQNEKNQPK